jgi:large subunit ribosomal protein L21
MYAVIETGGKQYRVEIGTELQVELLDVEPGNTITLDRVLLIADGDDASIGRPLVDGAAVSAEVLRRERGDKVIAFKYRPKARRRVKKGHRQELTVLRISDIVLGGKSAAKAAAKTEQDAKSERIRLEEAAAAQAAKDAELAAKLAAKAPAKETTRKSTAKAAAPAETAAPADDTKPSKAKSEAKPAEAKPAEAKPAEAKTAAAKPTVAKPTAEAKPTAAKPTAKRSTSKAKASADAKADPAEYAAADAKPKATNADESEPAKPARKPRTTKKDE